MSNDCIFCKIVRGEIPSTKVYEDDHVLAFMDIGPVIKGHVLVIPKEHAETIVDTRLDLLARLLPVVQRIAGAQMNGLKADGVNIMQNNGRVAGQLVPHFHIHVIPRFAGDGHKWNWSAKKYASSEETVQFAERIRSHCG